MAVATPPIWLGGPTSGPKIVDGRTEFGINVIYDIADRTYVYFKHIKYGHA